MKPDMLFEVSWEVCNKVGGIYRVIQSKIVQMKVEYGNQYLLIGPYLPDKVKGEFAEEEPPEWIKESMSELLKLGAVAHFGHWHTFGTPEVVLIDINNCLHLANEVKGFNWEHFQVDSLNTDFYDYDYPVLWANIAGRFIESIQKNMPEKRIVAHFHEWLSGAGLLYLKAKKSKVGCVFTTHATVMGRALAGSQHDLNFFFKSGMNFDEKAREFNIHAKHQTEKATAQNSDVFTTVSEITGEEAKIILQREPDVIVENGLDSNMFPTFEEASVKHRLFREKMRNFLMTMFYPHYAVDLEKSLQFFVSGRYEFYSKGINVLIDALGKLNKKLKHSKIDKNIFVFFFIPAEYESVNKEIIQRKSYFEDLEESLAENSNEIKQRLFYSLFSPKKLSIKQIIGNDFYNKFERVKSIIKSNENPACCTHIIKNKSDLILTSLRENNLNNAFDDKVKVIFYPTYLKGVDGLLDLDYFEAISACHLSIFPSVYEPWGYTPLESMSFGVPTITTDLAGFGRFIRQQKLEGEGVFVLNFEGKSYEERVAALVEAMEKYSSMNSSERIAMKMKAKNASEKADWSELIKKYFKAHQLAIERIEKNR